MKEKLVGIGAVLSAALASVCCLGPLILLGLGIGGVGLAAGLAPYRLIFLALTFALLGMAFYLIYRKREVQCEDGTCKVQSGSKGTKIALWIVTAAVLVLASSHLWMGAFSPKVQVPREGYQIKLAVTGMHCDACAVSVQKALRKVSGVKSALVDFDQSEAAVIVDSEKFDSQSLVKAVENTGYKASLKQQ